MSLTRPFPRNRGGLGLPTTASSLLSGWCWGVKLEPTFQDRRPMDLPLWWGGGEGAWGEQARARAVGRGSLAGGVGALGGRFG